MIFLMQVMSISKSLSLRKYDNIGICLYCILPSFPQDIEGGIARSEQTSVSLDPARTAARAQATIHPTRVSVPPAGLGRSAANAKK